MRWRGRPSRFRPGQFAGSAPTSWYCASSHLPRTRAPTGTLSRWSRPPIAPSLDDRAGLRTPSADVRRALQGRATRHGDTAVVVAAPSDPAGSAVDAADVRPGAV